MKVACKLLLGLALLQGAAYAADEPKIEVIDGKISMSAQAVALGRLLSMFDKAMGMKSEVKPDLANQNISVQFTDLNFNDAVRKIFQGQPLNYVVIQGKGIRVTDRAGPGSASVSDSPAFSSSAQPFTSPIQPIQVQPNPNQPGAVNIFGSPAPAAANPAAINPTAPMSGPGVMPPPIGANNPMITPLGGANGGTNGGGTIFPGGPGASPPVQPAAPGMIPGTTPGAAPGTIK